MNRISTFALLIASLPLTLDVIGCAAKDNSDDGQGTQTSGAGGTSTVKGEGGATSQEEGGATSQEEGGASNQAKGGTTSKQTTRATGGSSATQTTATDDLLIDDFEDGDGKPLVSGGWYGYTDESGGGNSTLVFTGATGSAVAMNGAGFESTKSLEVSYTFDQGTYEYSPYAGFGTTIGTTASPYDLSGYAGVSYTYKGGAHTVRVETTEVTDYDVFGVSVGASAQWKTVILPFKSFAQEGWGAKVDFDPSHATAISFGLRGATGDAAKLQIDNLKVVKTLGELTPDMEVKPSSPPADGKLETVEISNPLQAKAMQYLSKGYNITNWLEEKQFSDFEYDESYIQKLSQAGYKALRLPVDFDRYVETKTGTGDTLEITASSALFEVLDAFDSWTKKYGLSLTIDYHQYSTLLDKTDVDSLGTAVQLWGKVAEHFASNPREDIFFELLNEPELSFDADPTQAEWTQLAERMIAAIRAKDTTHSVIFGDTSWYGIDALVTRKPLSDDNVIYAFHNYDPFIFTHQGASWANMATTHDLPYPYDAARWSPYFLELGFNSTMESWILNAVKNYYREGNKATLRNKILTAKRWAVENNVPVICNEFGAYDQSSQLSDRTRYYADLIDIFDELAIPWQHWFMLMDAKTGAVIPEYRTALGLVAP